MKKYFSILFAILIGILVTNTVYAVPIVPNQAKITAEALDVDLERSALDASYFQLKIVGSENIGDYQNLVEVDDVIWVLIHALAAPELKKGDIITGVASQVGDEQGSSWRVTNIKIIKEAEKAKCAKLWWHDDDSKYCQQKEFCGMHAYKGLHTFKTKGECEADFLERFGKNGVKKDDIGPYLVAIGGISILILGIALWKLRKRSRIGN